jgi:hypothetical protein
MMGSRKNKKTVCELKKNCPACSYPIIPREKHECYKRHFKNCNQNMPVNHLCYMVALQGVVAPSNRVLYVLYDFETTQDTRYSEKATEHVPNLVCVQQFCSQCEDVADIEQDCPQCGKRNYSFWKDPVGDLLTYLCKPRPWANRVIAVAHNAKAFDLQFTLSRAIHFKWRPELIMNGM